MKIIMGIPLIINPQLNINASFEIPTSPNSEIKYRNKEY